jgi:MoxR-vWA-beta-propeller ternary system domain bpX0/MoxR-vWA-beta-propeller ternary system domain bpX1
MLDVSTKARQYFTPPKDYFWRWSNDMNIVEWHDGVTIAYRDELTAILKEVALTCEPKRLGAVLLVLAACREGIAEGSIRNRFFYEVLDDLADRADVDKEDYYINQRPNIIDDTLRFLNRISILNADLRREKGKILLIKHLFEDDLDVFKPHSLTAFVDEFASGRLDLDIGTQQIDLTFDYFKADLLTLYKLSRRYPDVHSLDVKIRTGLDVLPTSIELPEEEKTEEPDPLSILEELAADDKTAGLAALTLSVIAALNVPMHAQGASDLPLGGVSDLTNKGTYDKLLLSELAQDDDLLTARLVNNEALYLRREMPPAQPDRERVILLDTTLKMWGMPRPFALSAALALAENKKKIIETRVFALKGVTFDPLSISTKKDVLEALNHLSPALHCGLALADFMKQAPKTEAIDYVFISDEDAMSHPNFKALFNQQKPYLRFLIVINRLGALQFFEFKNGQSKLISAAQFDLNTLLFPNKKPQKTLNSDKKLRELTDDEMPSFIYHDPTPLFFPPVNLQLDEQNNFYVETVGVLVITKTQRVLWFKDRDKGAVELMLHIEEGDYEINYEYQYNSFFIAVYRKGTSFLKFYDINLNTFRIVDAVHAHLNFEIDRVVSNAGTFYVLNGQKGVTIELPFIDLASKMKELGNVDGEYSTYGVAYNRRFINKGYSILQRLKLIFINPKDCLSFENYYLDVNSSGEIGLIDTVNLPMDMRPNHAEKRLLRETFDLKAMPSNQQIKFYKVTWDCGSTAMLDSRGFLHLKSFNAYMPEITIVLVAGKTCACWSADGFYTGNQYFIPQASRQFLDKKMLTGQVFYDTYIRPFIQEMLVRAEFGLTF